MPQTRLALTITGGVSLGSFEAGAVAALIQTLRPLTTGEDPPLVIDAIGGTSAGAITGLLVARTLLEGLDPIRVMEAGWVDLPALTTLRDPRHTTPLTADELRAAAIRLLAVPRDNTGEPSPDRQSNPVRPGLTLTHLRGLEYHLARAGGRPPLRAVTHLDWTAVELHPGLDVAAFTEPPEGSVIDAVLASAANALGFPPVLIDRTLDRAAYRANGIRDLPESGRWWYTDGGTVDTAPLARTLDLAADLDHADDDGARRIQVLIHPDPTSLPTGNSWADPATTHGWLEVLGQVGKLQGTQNMYDDLRNLERTNTRLRWMETLADRVGPVLDDLDAASAAALRAALVDIAARIDADRAAFHDLHDDGTADAADATGDESATRLTTPHVGSGAAARAHVAGTPPAKIPLRRHVGTLDPSRVADMSLQELFATVTATVAGLENKTPVALEIISPVAIAAEAGVPVDDVLAGAFLGHFGGFLDRHLRASDFDLGYERALRWLSGGALAASDVDEATLTELVAAAREAKQTHDRTHPGLHPREPWRTWGGSGIGDLSWRARRAALGAAWSIARITAREFLHRPGHDSWPTSPLRRGRSVL